VTEVRLQHVASQHLAESLEVFARVEPLAGRDGKGQGILDLFQKIEAVWRDRLLIEAGPVACDPAAELDRAVNGQAPMRLDENIDRFADRLAHGGHQLFGTVHLVGAHLQPRRAEGIELQSTVTARDNVSCAIGEVLRRAGVAVPAVGVREEVIVDPAAEQLVDRLAVRLADDVPHGDLDPLMAVSTVGPPWY